MANPEHVAIVNQGTEAIRKWREEHPGVLFDLEGAILPILIEEEGEIRIADLQGADLAGANLRGANLREADLREANLYGATLRGAKLRGAKLRGANFSLAILNVVKGAERAIDLERVRLHEGDAFYFDECQRPRLERWLDWEHLRTMGRLPLFGVSYTVLILLPIVFYGLAFYNNKVAVMRAWAATVSATADHSMHRVATLILATLHGQPIPSLSLVLLVSTVLLAIGATLFTFYCPPRVREFSREHWCDQMQRSLLHYWPLSWKALI